MTQASVAIIGFAFRLPGTDVDHFWTDLMAGRDLVSRVDPSRWSLEAFEHPDARHRGSSYTFATGSIGDVSGFDAGFFGISPREAASMDPQQRILLELAWETLENARVVPSRIRGSRCGVFLGVSSADYGQRYADDLAAIDSPFATGNTASIAANRISYLFDLHGPSLALDTACSSSLVAFHQACRAISGGEADLALAGGISLHLHPFGFISFSKASMLSPRGRCRVFDAEGDGYVRSEGGGLFLLKPLDRALADGDEILATVVASGVNTDGHKSGLTVPNRAAQVALLEGLYAEAGIDPSDLDYLEAHGTGTAVGDPIEAHAIGEALGRRRPASRPLPVGSVKGNLGHLEPASGVAGLVKALYCLRHRTVPPDIGMQRPNPRIPFADLNLVVPGEPWPLKAEGALTVGVNSFGFGGANAHVVLRSPTPAPAAAPRREPAGPCPLLLSARSEGALAAMRERFAGFLEGLDGRRFYDAAWQLAMRRERLERGLLVFAESGADAARALRDPALARGERLARPRGPVLVFTGNGAQWPGMGRALLADPVFAAAIEDLDACFQPLAGRSLRADLETADAAAYAHTEVAQPALFALQVGLVRMLRQRGLRPAAVIGHSVGEVAAAWACGTLSLEDAVTVIHYRSHLQERTRGSGQMMALALAEAEARARIEAGGVAEVVQIAGINSPRGVTLSGPVAALDLLETAWAELGLRYKRLDLDYAFHGPAMDAIAAPLTEALTRIRPEAGEIPLFSTVSGGGIDGRALDGGYWWRNVREPVRFAAAVTAALEEGFNLFMEVGPHPILSGYVGECMQEAGVEGRVLPTLRRDRGEAAQVETALAQCVLAGGAFAWDAFFPRPGEALRLPNYPWQRERHWHEVTTESAGLLYRRRQHPLLGWPLPREPLTWENHLDLHLQPLLGDHVVAGTCLFPGSAYLELVVAAAMAWEPAETVLVEDLEILLPLALGKETTQVLRVRIDDTDGEVRLSTREYLGGSTWTLHGVGRIQRGASARPLALPLPERPGRPPDFDDRSHDELARAAGLDYGPAFRCIRQGWIDGDTALALLDVPEALNAELPGYYLHPALLDCTFQLLIPLLAGSYQGHSGSTWVPVRLGRAWVRTGKFRPWLAEARLLRRTPHALVARFAVFDASGVMIARIEEARFRQLRLHEEAGGPVRFLGSRLVPRPLQPQVPDTLVPGRVEACLRAGLAGEGSAAYVRYANELEPLLDSLCDLYLGEALGALARQSPGAAGKRVAGASSRYLECLLDRARTADISATGPAAEAVAPDGEDEVTPAILWNALARDYPEAFPLIHSVGRVGLHLTALLEGGAGAGGACPPLTEYTAALTTILAPAGRNPLAVALGGLLDALLAEQPAGSRLSILEIAPQGPLFGEELCTRLDFERGDYRFAAPCVEAREAALPFLERHPLAEIQDLEAVPPGSCQLALVTLAFPWTTQAGAALEAAHSRLLPGGILIAVGFRTAFWPDFVYGGHGEDWFSGSPPGPETPGQWTPEAWGRRLAALGYEGIRLLEAASAGPCLLIAAAGVAHRVNRCPPLPVEAGKGTWVIVADPEGPSAELATALETVLEGPERHALVFPAADEALEGLGDLLRRRAPVAGLLHLAGWRRADAGLDPEALMALQVRRCTLAARLMRLCETLPEAPPCWLLTSGGYGGGGAGPGADAALWGFGRSLMNETEVEIRLLELAPDLDPDLVRTCLLCELARADGEREVVLDRNGRFAPRLRLEPPSGGEMAEEDRNTLVRLGFEVPGQLRNLRWERHPRPPVGKTGVMVEVKATGLNFRDLMYTQGMLSDEAVENGFAGPTLGLEFAGVITALGEEVRGFRVGDRVLGFGPASFAGHTVTQATAVAPLPAGLSWEAAATIPSTFFTAYYALQHLARLQPGEHVLIHGAAGGVGLAAIQIAQWIGAEIHATAGSEAKRDALRLWGVEHIYDSRSLAFADDILEATAGRGVDVVLNSLAHEAMARSLRVLRPFGRFLELGKRDFYENTRLGMRPLRNNISYFGIDADQLMRERPDLARTLFAEIMTGFAEGAFAPLPFTVFDATAVVDAFRHMQQARQIGKVVVTYGRPLETRAVAVSPGRRREPPVLKADGTYLVTGGVGGFGLQAAVRLAAWGARHLLLVSRRGALGDEERPAVERLRAQGIEVSVRACDVTDAAALARLLAETGAGGHPLRGVVHAAMVIDDGLARDLGAERIRRVLAPKVLGALNLHRLTQGMDLDLFVLFSSATTLFGNPGQASYVAANAFLEALTEHRRAAGLPALCVRWGAIGDVGFLARHAEVKEALQARMGGRAMTAAQALDILGDLIRAGRSNLGVLELDWQALARFLPTAHSPRYEILARVAGEMEAREEDSEELQRLLDTLSDEELLAHIESLVQQEVGGILRIPPERVDPRRSLYEMGLDSLMGMELVSALDTRFGVRFPVVVLSETPTVQHFARWILGQLRGGDREDGLQARVAQVARRQGIAVEADEVAAFTREMAGRGGE